MKGQNLMQAVLGSQWDQLPSALRAHYQAGSNTDIGTLEIEFPKWMQLYLNLLHGFGALVNRRGKAIATKVEKRMLGKFQYWQRSLHFADGKIVRFNSHWECAGNGELIEYVNPFLGLRMRLQVQAGKLVYVGRHYVLRLGNILVPISEWLVLGHTTIVETALDAEHFAMDFRLQHPLFGQIYRYAGIFKTISDRA